MPNIITHVLLADEVLNRLNRDEFNRRKQLFEIGSNGPDFLFYSNETPYGFFKSDTMRKLGSEAHRHKINDFYKKALEIIQNEKDETIKNDMIVYVCGHLCHWALDSIAHPYIVYRSGDYQNKTSAWNHHRMESVIDALMLKIKRNETIKDYNVADIVDMSLEQARAIVRIYYPIGKDVFHVQARPHDYYQSLKDWLFLHKVFYDAKGHKFNTLYSIEKLMHKDYMLSGYLIPNDAKDTYDTLNLMKKKWVHPCDDSTIHDESFLELYDQALVLAVKVIEIFLTCIKDKENIHELMYILHDKNYNLGMDRSLPIKYFDVIYYR